MDRKKELKLMYKQSKRDMGIFAIRSKVSNKCYVHATKDLKGVMNGTLVRLESGMHPVKELQNDWKKYGSGSFTVEILEHLEYDKDESKTDYSEDLAILQMIWEKKLTNENIELYLKKTIKK